MKIDRIAAHVLKVGRRYQPIAQQEVSPTLPASDYLRLGQLPQLYSARSEAVLVKITTDTGLVGWGECQAPVGPEVVQTVIGTVLAPVLLAQDPLASTARYHDMLATMRVRGQGTGYQLDAIAGLDIALWDIRGKAAGMSVSQLLGGPTTESLDFYVTGLRGEDAAARDDYARHWTSQGAGVKLCLTGHVVNDIAEIRRVAAAVARPDLIMADALWSYDYANALRVGRVLAEVGARFFEAPLAPEDVRGHRRLSEQLDLTIAGGETLRTRLEFLPWLENQALGLCQPDLMRSSVTEAVRIAALAETFHVPTTLHTGCSTPVGLAATWQVAAGLPLRGVQEFQPTMMDAFAGVVPAGLQHQDGQLQVPSGPGIGVTVDEEWLDAHCDSVVDLGLD